MALYIKIIWGIIVFPEKTIYMFVFMLFLIFNFYLFLRNDFYKKILMKYENTKIPYGTFLVLSYMILSVFLFMYPFL